VKYKEKGVGEKINTLEMKRDHGTTPIPMDDISAIERRLRR
jgi:hypothetical protein